MTYTQAAVQVHILTDQSTVGIDLQTDRQIYGKIDKWIDKQMDDILIDRHIDGQTDKYKDMQTDHKIIDLEGA